ncbi:MAG: T9SS type A sorting domain-containing protein [Candidatus Komeilibacteria bacterium]
MKSSFIITLAISLVYNTAIAGITNIMSWDHPPVVGQLRAIVPNNDTINVFGNNGIWLKKAPDDTEFGLQLIKELDHEEVYDALLSSDNNFYIVGGHSRGEGYVLRGDESGWTKTVFNQATHIYDIIELSNSTMLVVGANGFMAKSMNSGSSWQVMSVDISSGLNGLLELGDGVLLMGSYPFSNSIYRSDNYGVTWSLVMYNIGGWGISTMQTSGNTIYATALDAILISNDAGLSWNVINYPTTPDNFDPTTVLTVVNEQTIITGGQLLHASENHGNTWQSHIIDPPLDGMDFFSAQLKINEVLWTISYNGIILSAEYNITALETEPISAQDYALLPNYPNPFNASTVISYELPQSGQVQLSVYNMKGEQMAQLINNWQTAGQHEINWSPGNIASGTYIVVITAQNKQLSRKLTIIK